MDKSTLWFVASDPNTSLVRSKNADFETPACNLLLFFSEDSAQEKEKKKKCYAQLVFGSLQSMFAS
jgi:hypothetical protein